MKKLALPGGGYFEIPIPQGGRYVEGPLQGAPVSTGGKVAAVAGGAVLGALITWAVIELLD